MNCQETRGLFEDALDRSLSGGVKRKFDLHLSRCRACRDLYAAEQAEHARWFRAMNDESLPRHALPGDFANRLVASFAVREKIGRSSFFRRFRLPRWVGIAAVFALMLFAFAAVVWNEIAFNPESEMDGDADRAVSPLAVVYEVERSSTIESESSMAGDGGRDAPSVPSGDVSNGEANMKADKLVANAKRAGASAFALAGISLGAAAETPYQFIISGYPAVNPCRSFVTASTTLETGCLKYVLEESPLEARQCTRLATLGTALNSKEYKGLSISIR